MTRVKTYLLSPFSIHDINPSLYSFFLRRYPFPEPPPCPRRPLSIAVFTHHHRRSPHHNGAWLLETTPRHLWIPSNAGFGSEEPLHHAVFLDPTSNASRWPRSSFFRQYEEQTRWGRQCLSSFMSKGFVRVFFYKKCLVYSCLVGFGVDSEFCFEKGEKLLPFCV